MFAHGIEKFIFWSRWLLSPLYLGLIVVMVLVVIKFCIELFELVIHIGEVNSQSFVFGLLSLLDYVLLSNLILIVLFAGYENFVSKIAAAENNVDRPAWMGHVDFSGLKIKLIGSIVAISVIELLKDFVQISSNPGNPINAEAIFWQVTIHLTFVVSGLLFAAMDWISDSRVHKKLGSSEALETNEVSRTVL
ncbi:MAG: hypothetical protein RLZ28_130 [Actinomycetota bacterium]|jgi:uncharacterized protein (TIGR00645 family)